MKLRELKQLKEKQKLQIRLMDSLQLDNTELANGLKELEEECISLQQKNKTADRLCWKKQSQIKRLKQQIKQLNKTLKVEQKQNRSILESSLKNPKSRSSKTQSSIKTEKLNSEIVKQKQQIIVDKLEKTVGELHKRNLSLTSNKDANVQQLILKNTIIEQLEKEIDNLQKYNDELITSNQILQQGLIEFEEEKDLTQENYEKLQYEYKGLVQDYKTFKHLFDKKLILNVGDFKEILGSKTQDATGDYKNQYFELLNEYNTLRSLIKDKFEQNQVNLKNYKNSMLQSEKSETDQQYNNQKQLSLSSETPQKDHNQSESQTYTCKTITEKEMSSIKLNTSKQSSKFDFYNKSNSPKQQSQIDNIKKTIMEVQMRLKLAKINSLSIENYFESLKKDEIKDSFEKIKHIFRKKPFLIVDEKQLDLVCQYLLSRGQKQETKYTYIEFVNNFVSLIGEYLCYTQQEEEDIIKYIKQIISQNKESLFETLASKAHDDKQDKISLQNIIESLQLLDIDIEKSAFELLVMKLFEQSNDFDNLPLNDIFNKFLLDDCELSLNPSQTTIALSPSPKKTKSQFQIISKITETNEQLEQIQQSVAEQQQTQQSNNHHQGAYIQDEDQDDQFDDDYEDDEFAEQEKGIHNNSF